MRKLLSLLPFLILSFPTVSNAGNVDTFGIGSKATALGGAFSAYADEVRFSYTNIDILTFT